ncbi:Glycosyl hydrolase, BNR repeat protein [Labilithrix luteola]|uniref:Glycosyl hydrolase, BNR repeat protein n=1 Tax=Labilithrix luteola TaxID=1391654 RepID=A0A0K1PSV9_9BACT|nr:hypothetical protein [Labilithrix luteola]AKU96630.1 Glycosyl hydrolase, BNR repeat protein [Labilithrix luteola]
MSVFRVALASVGLLALVACSSSDPVQPSHPQPDAGTPTWQTVLQPNGGALLSIWGTSEKDVWTVGGPLGNTGFESLVIRFDGTSWKRVPVGGPETFWWVHGSSASDVWLVGEKGRITHWDGTKFEERTSGTTATLFGVYAFAPNDAWAVGGRPDQAGSAQDSNVVLHWDGTEWRPETLPSASDSTSGAFFKVWGTRTDDLYVVGENAVVWHRVGTSWRREAEGLGQGRLTTVTGCSASEIYVVGGRDLLTSDGQTFSRSDELLVNDVNGVACAPASAPARPWGNVVAVGGGSLKLRRVSGVWESDFGTEPYSDLHGAWVDPSGAFWAVGGDFNTAARPGSARAGVVARLGDGTVASAYVP